jgi:prepilin-type N-terminal cleavage/methylation domain-containing protein
MRFGVRPEASARIRVPRAFTIIEMLVVLVIIGILAGIVITLAQRVTQGGKFSATRNVVQLAENMLTEYVSSRDGSPPMYVKTNQTQQSTTGTDDMLSPDTYLFPVVDGRFAGRTFGGPTGGGPVGQFDKDRDPPQPSGALLLLAMKTESSTVERELKAVDNRFLQLRDVFAYGWLVNAATGEPGGQLVLRRLRLPVLIDAFGNPIRYVHPGFQGGHGDFWNNAVPAMGNHRAMMDVVYTPRVGQPLQAQFSRSYRPFVDTTAFGAVGDADEGLAIGGHGYFYSAGLDGDPGTREDNVYNKQPSFPTETAKLN